MPGPDDSEFDRRIVFKIPEYMPELRDELMKYPPNQCSKRMLQLACLGLMSSIVAKPGGQAEASQAGKKIEKPARGGSVQPKQHHQQDDVQIVQPANGEPPALPAEVTQAALVAQPVAIEQHQQPNESPQELVSIPADEVDSPAGKGSEAAPAVASGGRRKNGPSWPTAMHT